MEYKIQKTIFSVHELIVEKELFNEKKEYEAWLKPGSEDLQDMVRVLHSRQIGNQKFEINFLQSVHHLCHQFGRF